MNVIDVILEKTSIKLPFDVFTEDGFICESFEDGYSFLNEVITEATNNTTKLNIFQKLWGAIKKIFDWCRKQFNRFVEFLRKTFSYKNPKTIDQLAAEAGIKMNLTNAGKIKSISEQLPADDSSQMAIDQAVNLFYKPFEAQFVGKTVKIKPIEVNLKLWANINFGAKGQGNNAVMGNILLYDNNTIKKVIALIKNPNLSADLLLISQLINGKDIDSGIDNKIETFLTDIKIKSNEYKMLLFDLTLEEVMDFQKKLNSVMESFQSINDPESNFVHNGNRPGFITNNNAVPALNKFVIFASQLQMAINLITASISHKFIIDAAYKDTVNDPEVLSVFVQKMIDAGIPPKFIAYNSYCISKGDIKGWKGTARKPIWGQSRLVFFPENNKGNVYKIALSGWGRESNKSELMTSESFKKHGGEQYIALITGATTNRCIVSQEQVKTFKQDLDTQFKMQSKINILSNNINKFCRTNNIPINLADIHLGNIGERDGNIIVVDYGFAVRSKLHV